MNRAAKWRGVVTKTALPVRTNPDSKAKPHSFSPISKGVTVDVCDTAKGWLYISIGGKYGYVSAKWVKFTEDAPGAAISKTPKWAAQTTRAVSLRTFSGAKAETVPKGAILTVCDTFKGKWYVRYNKRYGVVNGAYTRYIGTAKDRAAVFLAAVKAVQERARKQRCIWADSQSIPPGADGKISCDRLVARALWDLGYTDQVKGGIALGRGFESYLTAHGFKRSTSADAIRAGSVCVVVNPSGVSRHVFVVASRSGNKYTRYDCGSTEWIQSKQPLPGLWLSRLLGVYNL